MIDQEKLTRGNALYETPQGARHEGTEISHGARGNGPPTIHALSVHEKQPFPKASEVGPPIRWVAPG